MTSDSPLPRQPATAESTDPAGLPNEVVPIHFTHYRVGQFRYTNLPDAMAEYHRQQRAGS